jgi:hypothetical protein
VKENRVPEENKALKVRGVLEVILANKVQLERRASKGNREKLVLQVKKVLQVILVSKDNRVHVEYKVQLVSKDKMEIRV